MDYLEAKLYLSERQFGFRRGKSAEDAVVYLTNKVSAAVDQNQRCLGIFLDLAKAFDTVSTRILIAKLEAIGIRGIALKWFISYLTNRKQCLRVENSISDELSVSFGVPQGSILGPTLFAVYMNDILNISCTGMDIICYADDTVAIFRDSTWESVITKAEVGMRNIAAWLNNNLLTLNTKKNKFVAFYKTRASQPKEDLHIKIHTCVPENEVVSSLSCPCECIERVDQMKYLGILVDSALSFKVHIKTLSARVRKIIYIMKALRASCDKQTITMVYTALCQSILSYCNLAWGGAAKTVMIELERAQRAVLKVMLSKPFRFSTRALYQEAEVLTVRQLFIIKAACLIHKKVRGSSIWEDLIKRRVFRVPLPSTSSSYAKRHPQYLHTHIYNKVNKVCSIKEENVVMARRAVHKWLITQSYDDTEQIIN